MGNGAKVNGIEVLYIFCLVTARSLQRYCMVVAVLLHQPCSIAAPRVAVDVYVNFDRLGSTLHCSYQGGSGSF